MQGEIRNTQGEYLDTSFAPGRAEGKELVVIGHGVTANKDRPWLVALSEALQDVGIASLRFSFAGNGASEGSFTDATISKEVEDLGCVLDSVADWHVYYVGHSMGAAVGVLRAHMDVRIRGMVSLAGMVHTRDFAERKFGQLRPGQDCMWEKEDCPLSQAFMDDMKEIDSVVGQAASIEIPWLLVHGTADEVVFLQDSVDIQKVNEGRTRLVKLEGADHVFSGTATQQMTEAVVPWLRSFASS